MEVAAISTIVADRFGQAMSTVSKHRILLVDPDRDYMGRLAAALARDFEVFTLADPAEALSQLESICPDLVVLEMDYPAMDGFKLATSIRRHPKQKGLPFIFLSWRDSTVDMRLGYMIGAGMCLGKRADFERISKNLSVYILEHAVPIRDRSHVPKETHAGKEEQPGVSPRETTASAPGAPPVPLSPPAAPPPAHSPPAAPPPPVAPSPAAPQSTSTAVPERPRVLIGESDCAVAFSIENLLQGVCNCVSTCAGMAVLEKAQRYNPDLIVLNVRMSQIPGFEICQMLRNTSQFQSAPVFGVAKADDPMRSEYTHRYGFTEVFASPSEIDRLAWRIKNLVKEPGFVQRKYPQSFTQVWSDEERDRMDHERSEVVGERQQHTMKLHQLIKR